MMTTARRQSCQTMVLFSMPALIERVVESVSDTPTIKRKNGNMQSVNVHPFHTACRSGA